MPTPEEILGDKRGASSWVRFPKGSCLESDHTGATTGILSCIAPGIYDLLVHSRESIKSDLGHFIKIKNNTLFNSEALSKLEPLKPRIFD